MKSNEFITEDDNNISQLKTDIIRQVKKTSDEELLDRIYTVLNKSDLVARISGTLERDTDTAGYVEELTKIIIDTPGTFQEKYEFINGFPTGYVDIKLMLSGDRVKFDELLSKNTFVRKVFDQLKRVTFGTAKGPGEFALAVMSPGIRITGKGDLNIGNDIIEVKASAGKDVSSGGGRLGTPGLLHSDDVESIIVKNLKVQMSKVMPDGNLSLKGLIALASNTKPGIRTKLGNELFSYIFKSQVPVTKLVSAFSSGDVDQTKQEYIKTNYALYQQDSGFSGIMLMNFALGELQYYRDSEEMIKHIYDPGVYIISKDKAAQARQIISQVTLRPFKEPPLVMPELPTTGKGRKKVKTNDLTQLFVNYATTWGRKYGITDPSTIQFIAQTIIDLKQKDVKNSSIETKLKKIIAPMVDQIPTQTQPPVQAQPIAPLRERRANFESVRQRR
jgi:hypothetical protein